MAIEKESRAGLGAGGPVAGVQEAQGLGQVGAEDLAAEHGEQRGQQAALGGAGQPADGELDVAAAVPVRADAVLPGTAWPERVGVDDFQPDRLGAGPVVAGERSQMPPAKAAPSVTSA